MATLVNEIVINAPVEKIWKVLANVGELAAYDPTIKESTQTSALGSGLGASRKVVMLDGKNWFEEKTTVCKLDESLAFELTACSFPIKSLKHSYSFQKNGNQTKVTQVMEYEVKYGIVGKILDWLMIRRQFDGGIKKFFGGLRSHIENTG